MSFSLLLIQCLNGLQYGVLLFLIAAGLTLVFGVMGFINLAHGVQYMVGAYLAFAFYGLTGNFFLALVLSLVVALIFGLLLEVLVFRHLYERDHLDQVLATFGIILFLNEAAKVIFGPLTLTIPPPEFLSGSVQLTENLRYPVYRFATIAAGLAVAVAIVGHRHPYPRRHVDPRRGQQPHDGVGAGRQYPTSVYGGIRLWCDAGRICRCDCRADLFHRTGHG